MGTVPAAVGSRSWVTICAVIATALTVTSITAAVGSHWSWQEYVDTYSFTNAVLGIALAGSGAMIGWFRPKNAVGILFAIAGISHLISAALAPLGMLGLELGWPVWLTRLLAGIFLGAWAWGLPHLAILALMLFPDGRLPSPRWRPTVWYILVVATAVFALSMVNSYELVEGNIASRPLFAIEGLPMAELETVINGWLTIPLPFFLFSALITRYVRGDEQTRRQLMWLILAVIGIFLINAQRLFTGTGPILLLLSTVLIPVAIAIAILRYQLLDIRLVLSRTLLYGMLITAIIAVYAGLVAALTLVVPADADRVVTIVAAVAAALIFNPLRTLLQRIVARAFFGSRDDPARTVAQVGSGGLDAVLAQLRQALRLPYLAVAVDGEIIAADGSEVSRDDPTRSLQSIELPLEFGMHPEPSTDPSPGAKSATLRVGLRLGERRPHDADERALSLVLPSIGLLLRERQLLTELRQARSDAAQAREKERKALHRDLHDGLGPTLTGAAMRLDAASNLLRSEETEAREILGQARTDIRGAIDEVRHVVYGLRPVALDEGGLVKALNEEARGAQMPPIRIHVDQSLPPLSPAVELAAYRVTMEGITNARRHANASQIDVNITMNLGLTGNVLTITVTDDGTPSATFRPGAGIRSMHERVEELGGELRVGPAASGWEVSVMLPIG